MQHWSVIIISGAFAALLFGQCLKHKLELALSGRVVSISAYGMLFYLIAISVSLGPTTHNGKE